MTVMSKERVNTLRQLAKRRYELDLKIAETQRLLAVLQEAREAVSVIYEANVFGEWADDQAPPAAKAPEGAPEMFR